MPKLISLIKRQPHLTHEEFRDYYENVHVPLGVKHHGKYFADYRRNYVRHEFGSSGDTYAGSRENPAGGSWPGYDAILEIWFKDQMALDAMLRESKAQAADPNLVGSRGKFIDQQSMRRLIVDEEISDLSGV